MTRDFFAKILGKSVAEAWYSEYDSVCKKYSINTPKKEAAFLANLMHETGNFSRFTENLNYSKKGLLQVFSKYFNDSLATSYANNPQKIANRVYANRMGNGSESSGDGWKYRGRGGFMITGKDNYKFISRDTGIDFVTKPELLLQKENVLITAGWFWNIHKLNVLSEKGDIMAIIKRINGGVNGSEERLKNYKLILKTIQ